MIVQSTRISRSSGVAQLAKHLLDKPDENEKIVVLAGDRAALADAHELAIAKECTYSIRHLSISPEREMGRRELATFLQSIDAEFGIGWDRPRLLVMHEKNGRTHFHLAVAEVDPSSMKVLDCRCDFSRLEALARNYERERGETVQPTRLERRAAQVVGFSQQARKVAERVQPIFDRTALKSAWTRSPIDFSAELKRQGLTVALGKRALILVTKEGTFVAAAHRVVGVKKNEFSTTWRTSQNDRSTIATDRRIAKNTDRKSNSAHSDVGSNRSRTTAKSTRSHRLTPRFLGKKTTRSGLVRTSADTVDFERVIAYLDDLLRRARELASSYLSSIPATRRERLLAAIEHAKSHTKSDETEPSLDADQPRYTPKI